MRLVAKDGKLLEPFNKEQLAKFKEVAYWYEKAVSKITKRYARGVEQNKESRYAEAVAKAIGETEEIDERYQKAIDGNCTVEEFKESVSKWFYKVKEGMDDADIED